MKYDPGIHHRRSIRLQGYDYSQAGLYFITICTQERNCLFGEIENGEMILNDAGRMIEKWYAELENKFSDIRCDEMVIMPNHFHCIVQNIGVNVSGEHESALLGEHQSVLLGEHVGSPLHRVVQWFKTMTTNEYIRGVKTLGWTPFNGKLWQRNYWEHIIRDENAYQHIAQYIINNPQKWHQDKLNKNEM